MHGNEQSAHAAGEVVEQRPGQAAPLLRLHVRLQLGQRLLQAILAERRRVQPRRFAQRHMRQVALVVGSHRQPQRIVVAQQLAHEIHQLRHVDGGRQAQHHA
ncbi:hypothetical protein BAY1663_05069 [Pseudomonas sp. BAY1663]|nr:hypothetical protein BAY1663_05069 [Pseudomonas sp. BAY1663]